MADTAVTPVVDYLRMDGEVDEDHLVMVRHRYRQVLRLSDDLPMPDDPDETALGDVALQLNLRLTTDEDRNYLQKCVKYTDINDSRLDVLSEWIGEVKPIPELKTFNPSVHARSTAPNRPTTRCATPLADIDCTINIKMQTPELQEFIHSFLFFPAPESASVIVGDNRKFLLANDCLLYLFIRQQLRDRDTITSSSSQHSTRYRLIEPVSLTDDFGTWQFDRWRGLFDIELAPHGDTIRFPSRWKLADEPRIHCRLHDQDAATKASTSLLDGRPRITSLEVFVRDVCHHANSGQADVWLRDLHEEDVLTFEHLANLRHGEWENIRKLTVNARKTLRAAVDRERESSTGERRKRLSSDPDEDADNEMTPNSENRASYSRSELLANIHLIKLFISHALREERPLRRRGALPKLEAKCLDVAFEEMRQEGFADDGLFERMREFFLPLTISEQELRLERGLAVDKRQNLLEERDRLLTEMKQLRSYTNEQKTIFWTYDDRICSLQKQLDERKVNYCHSRSSTFSKGDSGQQQQQAQSRQELDRQWRQQHTGLMEKIRETQKLKADIEKVIVGFEEKLDENQARFENIVEELRKPRKHVEKQLVKPARGLIMYGPPGTGKSEIMSKLAVKLGIAMVGPPLAAGELNRPLVGESERVLIALCTRCHRIPYTMCCVSIDEIDSLAPKRDEDSSEGKVDKISVLLSLIDGIKDVPNLLILCATNRLHMMDEAFLRRMSGKFFVGRPSSQARISILKNIPDWALEPDILDHLSSATTNFSGAALRAFTRAITVKCIDTQRSSRNYQMKYAEALTIADRTAQQYQIFFGSETLPRLLLRNLSKSTDGPGHRVHQLSPSRTYTGRIVVDLCSSHVRIEIYAKQTHEELDIVEHQLHSSETNIQTLLERLTSYGKNRNVQLLQLIDLNLLASQGAYDEKKVFETLKDRYDECVAYNRSMIIYDLDALVGVNKSESDSNMGRSTSSSIVNQNIYTYVRARFRDCVMEDQQQQKTDTMERWAVAVIREPFLLRQFCTDVQFTRTRHEKDEIEAERRKAEELRKCVKCKDFYIENENKMGNCTHHDGFVYDNSAADLTIYTHSEAASLLNKLEADSINDIERREELERQKAKFKWICCDAALVSGSAGGCKKGKHGFEIPDENQQQPATISRLDQLDHATVAQWEESCRLNEEYNDKWLKFLQERT